MFSLLFIIITIIGMVYNIKIYYITIIGMVYNIKIYYINYIISINNKNKTNKKVKEINTMIGGI